MRGIAIALLVLCGCGKSNDKDKEKDKAAVLGGLAGPGGSARDAVIEAWKKGGLTTSPMTTATVAFGKDCQSGTVNSVDVLVCAYPTAAEAKAAEDPGLTWVGDTTGAAQAHGALLIAVADRRKTDPSGRTINQLMKLAPK